MSATIAAPYFLQIGSGSRALSGGGRVAFEVSFSTAEDE